MCFPSGFIHKKIKQSEMCFDCLDFLVNCPVTVSSPLIKAHDRGGLMHPSHSTDRLVKVAHNILKPLLHRHIFKE